MNPRWSRSVVVAVVAALAALLLASCDPPAGAADRRERCTRPDVVGDTTVDVHFAGVTYPVLVHVPAGVDRRERLPVVLDLHGSTSVPAAQLAVSGLRTTAQANGFLVAAPSGAIPFGGGFAWNVPGVPLIGGTPVPAGARDDVAFLGQVLGTVVDELCGDAARAYSTGFSGGARMSSALACELADRVAAVAPVAGLRAGRPDPADPSVPEPGSCRPARPVPVLSFHGLLDATNPYAGNPTDLRWGYTVPVAAAAWAALDGCRRPPRVEQVSPNVSRLQWAQCEGRAEVELYTVADGQHRWPGSDLALPGTTQEIEASDLLWAFFRRHRLPPR